MLLLILATLIFKCATQPNIAKEHYDSDQKKKTINEQIGKVLILAKLPGVDGFSIPIYLT